MIDSIQDAFIKSPHRFLKVCIFACQLYKKKKTKAAMKAGLIDVK